MSHKPKPRKITSLDSRLRYCHDTGKLFWVDGPKKEKEAGWSDQHGYKLTRVEGQLVRNHHIIWYLHYGEWPEEEIDHRDNDPTNNRIENLRSSGRKGQGANQKLQKRRAGKWKGVHKTSSGKYCVKIKHEGKSVRGLPGDITCPKEAALVYNMWAERLFGPWAKFNEVYG